MAFCALKHTYLKVCLGSFVLSLFAHSAQLCLIETSSRSSSLCLACLRASWAGILCHSILNILSQAFKHTLIPNILDPKKFSKQPRL